LKLVNLITILIEAWRKIEKAASGLAIL